MSIKQLLKSPLIQVILISSFIFILFFPQFYTSTDEREYIENAYLITQNRLVKEDTICQFNNVYCGYSNENGYVSKYNLGLSFIFIPFVLISWQLTFVATFVFYLLGVFIFSKLLSHYKLSPWFLYLYAFFPLLVYYSKKPMGEIFSNTIVLAIYYLLFAKDFSKVKSVRLKSLLLVSIGILSGTLVLIRYTNAIIIFIFLTYYFYSQYKIHQKLKLVIMSFVKILIGAFPFIMAFLIINKTLYGSYFSSGYALSHEELLIIPSLIPKQLLIYIGMLNIIYPGMIIISFLSRIVHRWFIYILLSSFILFYIGFPGYDFNSGILDFIFGLRFFVPIVGLILLLYFDGLTQLWSFKLKKFKNLRLISYLAIPTLIVVTIVMSFTYYDRVILLKNQSDSIYNKVEEGGVIVGGVENRILLNEAFKKGKRWLRIPN